MKRRLLGHSGVIRVIRLGAALAFFLWPASSWAQENTIRTNFEPSTKQELQARSTPAKITIEDESALTSKGYERIGTVSASQPGQTTSPQITQALAAAILAKAAVEGGDVVRLEKEGALETVEVPTGKTKKRCTAYQEAELGTRPVYKQHGCRYNINGIYECPPADVENVPNRVSKCTDWEEAPVTKTGKGLISQGTVWTFMSWYKIITADGRGDVAAIKALIQGEPGLVARKDKYGVTPLQAAARGGYKAIVEFLLSNGADVNAKDQQFATPLHWAAYGGYNSTVALLLASGADVKAIAAGGKPLDYAVSGGHKDVAVFLLANGADLDASSYEGKTLLHDAGSKEMAEFLLAKGFKVNAKDYRGETPLHCAAFSGKEEVAEFLLAKGADVNARDDTGGTPLNHAVHWGYIKVIELLLAKGADVNNRDADSRTPLSFAMTVDASRFEHPNDKQTIVDLLRKHGGHE
jgi:ankyrin repeat protein